MKKVILTIANIRNMSYLCIKKKKRHDNEQQHTGSHQDD